MNFAHQWGGLAVARSGFYRNADKGYGGGGSGTTHIREIDFHIDDLLRVARTLGASDVIVKSGSIPRFAIDGKNVLCIDHKVGTKDPLSPQEAQQLIFDILSDRDIERLERTGDLDCAHSIREENGGLRNFRVNVFKERKGYGAVFRVLEPTAPSIEELFSHDPAVIPVFRGLLQRKQGLILVTGPTGSGKSTTIAAMLQDYLDKQGGTLVTLEDPVEFHFEERHPGALVIQRQIETDTTTFGSGLRAALREKPTAIMVGEMRDKESVEEALQAAQTGHLVVATLHTNSAKDTILRIINAVGQENAKNVQTQLSQALIGIISQVLVPRAKSLPGGPMYARNKIAVPEVLLLSPAIANQIRDGKVEQIDNSLQTSGQEGMRTRDQSLQRYHMSGIISLEAARGVARDVSRLN